MKLELHLRRPLIHPLLQYKKILCVPPALMICRWKIWCEASMFHMAHLEDYSSFFIQETENNSSSALQETVGLSTLRKVKDECNVVAEFTPRIIQTFKKT